MKPEIQRYPDLEELGKAVAEFISDLSRKCVEERGVFTIVLSGGKTPRSLYRYLAQPRFDAVMPWPHTQLFWGDERCVQPDHPDSNFAMASDSLISKVPVPTRNVHRMPAELRPPGNAAETYPRYF